MGLNKHGLELLWAHITSRIDSAVEGVESSSKDNSSRIVKGHMYPFAQTGYINSTRNYGLQGSVIDEENNYFTSLFLNSDYTEMYVLIDNYDTGAREKEVPFTYDGHANDCCIFNNKLIVVNSSGNNAHTIFTCDYPSLENAAYVTAPRTLLNITTDGKYMYGLDSNYNFYKMDSTYTIVESYPFPMSDDKSILTQGITYHDGYFYLAASAWINSNQLSFVLKFDIKNYGINLLLLYHFDSGNELEGASFINDKMYLAYRTTGMCALNRALVEPSMDLSYQFYRDVSRPFTRSTSTDESFYVSDQAGFFVDGSQDKPFRIPNLATDFIYPHFYQCILHIIGDHSSESLTFIDCAMRMYVSLESAQINNINIYRCDNVVVNGTSTSTIHGAATLQYNNKVNFTDVTMDTADTAFTIVATNFTLDGVTYTGAGTFVSMNDSTGKMNTVPANASKFISSTNSTVRYDASLNANHAQFAKITTDDNMFTKMVVCNNYSGALNIFNFNCDMYFSSSCALTDTPDGMSSAVRLKTERVNGTSVIQRLYYGSTSKGYVEYMRYVPQSQVAGAWVNISGLDSIQMGNIMAQESSTGGWAFVVV